MKRFLLTFLFLFLSSGLICDYAWGLNEPHSRHRGIACSSCHSYVAVGAGPHGTRVESNYGLCKSCHNEIGGKAGDLPFLDEFKNYTVGISGAFHKWDVYTSNSNFGASAPTNPEMLRVINSYAQGKVTCSVCHNQHGVSDPSQQTAGRRRLSPVTPTESGIPPGIGRISYRVTEGAPAMGWYVEIVSNGDPITYKVTSRLPYSFFWMGYDAINGKWVRYSSNAKEDTGGWQSIDNDNNVQIDFLDTYNNYAVGQQWRFYYAYPLLRAFPDSGDNVNGTRFCRDCHAQRAQSHFRDGNKWDGKMKSHPVGVPLNANGGGYDRKPLDVDGKQQGTLTADTNSTNDLLLFQDYTTMLTTFGNLSSGDVQCMSCHAPHWTDSNSQTVDLR